VDRICGPVLGVVARRIAASLFRRRIGAIEISRGVKPEDLGEAITSKLADPYMFMLIAAMGQLAFAIAGSLPAYDRPNRFVNVSPGQSHIRYGAST
jgi:hypothetical protein